MTNTSPNNNSKLQTLSKQHNSNTVSPVASHATVQVSSTTSKHYHLMGIGGIGMSAFARLLHANGHRVSGCDQEESEQICQLQNEGIPVLIEHDPKHISHDWGTHGAIDVLVASEAVPKTHPEIKAALECGVVLQQRMSLLGEFLRNVPSIGIVGTHGKTTTTSMTAIAFEGAGLDPSAFVGGNIPRFGGNTRNGQGPFIAEVDESDRAFAELGAETAVFLNAEDDHVGGSKGAGQATYWCSVEEQHQGFARFIGQSKRVLYNSDQSNLLPLCQHATEILSFGFSATDDYSAQNIQTEPTGTTFEMHHQGKCQQTVRIVMPGRHNVLNALAALALVHLYGGNVDGAAQALAQFHGPKRRWEHIGTFCGAQVIDDYAHNPTKVASALEAARQTGKRTRVIFQPHRYLRTEQSWPRLAKALMNADEVFVLDIAAATEQPIEGIHATLISNRMQEQGHQQVSYQPDPTELLHILQQSTQADDLILTMGAGDVWKIAHQLVALNLSAPHLNHELGKDCNDGSDDDLHAVHNKKPNTTNANTIKATSEEASI